MDNAYRHIFNYGTGNDSLFISVVPKGVNPSTALSVSPTTVRLAPNDSIGITFTFHPRQIIKTGLGIYSPSVVIDSRFNPGTTRFEKAMRFRLTGTVSVKDESKLPSKFKLEQNYPNPFNPETKIEYVVSRKQNVELMIYDVLGKEITTLINEVKESGRHSVVWDGKNEFGNTLPSGVFIYKIKAGEFTQVKKIILLR